MPPQQRLATLRTAFALLFAALAACSQDGSAQGPSASASAPRIELTVYAATSARDALQNLETRYEEQDPVDLVFNFGSSGDLSNQIVAAAKADVFLSADDKEMDKVEAAKLVVEGTRRALLSNRLVVIEPEDGPSRFSSPFEPSQLGGPEVKLLSLGNVETVPAGRYAKAWLEKVGVWSSVADRVLPGVDVRAALAAVESGGAQAGIVYRTDVARSRKARVVHEVVAEDGPKITYPVAVVAGREREREARAFAEYLASPSARPTFEEFGFVFLPAEQEDSK